MTVADQPAGTARAALAGATMVVIAAICFGTLGPVTRYAGDAGVGSLALATWRSAIGGILIAAFVGARMLIAHRPPVRLATVPITQRWLLLGAAVANTALNLSIFIAFVRIQIALALLVFYLYPVLVALGSVVWFGERLDRTRWSALAISLSGMVLVVAGAGDLGHLDALGIGLALVAAVSQMFYVLAARHGFSSVPGAQAAGTTMLLATAFYLGIALVTGQLTALAQPFASGSSLWPVLVAGSLGAALPTVLYVLGIRRIGAPRAAILAMIEPLTGVTLAALLLGEGLQPIQALGGAMILAAGALLQLGAGAGAAEHEALAQARAD
ncbi:MAG: DMT family transporter [Chloroflexota bacterium]|nr:DMT family transporter [Chloroflexota bacterium]